MLLLFLYCSVSACQFANQFYANKRECKAVCLKCGRGMDGWMFSRIYITAYRNAGLKKQTDLFFVAERSF